MKKWIVVALIILVAVGGYMAWRSTAASRASNVQDLSYVTAVAKRSSIEVSITGTSNLVASDRRTVKSTVSGTIAKVHVEDGQRVREGETVMTIQNEDLLEQMENARLDLESQQLRLTNMLTPSDTDLATAELKARQAETTLRNRQKDLEALVVRAPAAGRVSTVRVNVGDTVSSQSVLLSLSQDTEVLVMAEVLQSDVSKIEVGQSATVGFGSEFPSAQGTVFSISAEASSVGRNVIVPVAIKIPNPQGVYRAGLATNITIYGNDIVYATGSVAPFVRYDVRAEISGSIKEVLVKAGDSVQAGQELIRLSQDNIELLISQAENELRIALDNLERIKNGYAPNVSESDVRQQELRVRQSELTYRKRLEDVEALQVKSPINGTLVSRAVSVGDTVSANANLFVVADYSTMNMVIAVDELDIMQVNVGQPATVTADALPAKQMSGEVTKIAQEGTIRDGIASYDVTITLPGEEFLRGSLSATASILIASKQDALVLPAEAVRTVGRMRQVVLLKDGVTETVPVQVGLSNDLMTEIVSGIQEGDVVVISSLDRSRPVINTPVGGIRR